MSIIVPCITVEIEDEYHATIERFQSFATRVQIDISDGEFAPVLLLQPDKLTWPSTWQVDIHVMAYHPEKYIDQLIKLRPSLIILHAEAKVDLKPLFAQIKQSGIKIGLALLKTTVPSSVEEYIKVVDHVLIFSGDLGHYGGTASMMQLEKVRLVRAINPKVEVGWDGGVSVDNAFTLRQGGVDVLNTGGAVNKAADPVGVYNQLLAEANKEGVV